MKNQRGDVSIIIIIALLIGGLILLQFAGKSSNDVKIVKSGECISSGGPQATFNGEKFNRIKSGTLISSTELEYHLVKPMGIADTIYGQLPASVTSTTSINVLFTDGAENLLFVNVNDVAGSAQEISAGLNYYEVYLKEGKPLPNFIQEYCNNNYPTDSKSLVLDAMGKSFPPLFFKVKDVAGFGDNPEIQRVLGTIGQTTDETYHLFAYDTINSRSGQESVGKGHLIPGTLTAAANGKTKTYAAYFNPWSVILYISIVDNDPSSPDSQVVYKYASSFKLGTTPITQTPRSSFGSPKSLQLRTFSGLAIAPWGWWTPECKPAIYLYPKEKTDINVKVEPKGYLTYTDPKYPVGGWQVVAYPDGKISTNGKDYNYLYYESKIKDSEINKPDTGFIVAFNELPNLYDQILPKLGLNGNETKDFKEYWEKYLPRSPYYFVGIMDERSIEKIEPLSVNPKPESVIRVRLYFEAMDKKISFKEPTIITPKRTGYTLVEWGGLVKTDSNNPFTCSQ